MHVSIEGNANVLMIRFHGHIKGSTSVLIIKTIGVGLKIGAHSLLEYQLERINYVISNVEITVRKGDKVVDELNMTMFGGTHCQNK